MDTFKKRKGFTLIELVIVVAIIGILLLIILPQFQNVTRNAAKKTVESNFRNIVSAYNVYQAMHNGKAPTKRQIEPFINGGWPKNGSPEGSSYTISGGVIWVDYDGGGIEEYEFHGVYPEEYAGYEIDR